MSEYRYTLSRDWLGSNLPLVFIMLNPSTADETNDDPTIRRCIGFAKREDASGIRVVNLFALRATDPAALRTHRDPVGPENDAVIHRMAMDYQRGLIAAWGSHPFARTRAMEVRCMARQLGRPMYCFGTTKDGSPRHPLYVKGNQPIQPYVIAQMEGRE